MVPFKVLITVHILLVWVGIALILCNQIVFKLILSTNLVLKENSQVFTSWQHIPEKLPMDIYFFNWTNPQDIYNVSVKPKLEQVGPYRFFFDLIKTNISWNENGTVTYRQKKFWYFNQEGTNGSLNDRIYTLNVPSVGASHAVRTWNYFLKKFLSITLSSMSSELYFNGTVDEFLFTGFPDALTKISGSVPGLAEANIPVADKFGYFYKRNGSDELDGTINLGTGTKATTFGTVYNWNYQNHTSFYEDDCAKVTGTTGVKFDVFEKPKIVTMFITDLCRYLNLQHVGDKEIDGIKGYEYVIGERTLDNGSRVESNKCFCNGQCSPSGIFNISSCRYGAPVFMSLPHFFQADPYFTKSVVGLNPEKEKHQISITIEPNTGIPLEVNFRLQLNFLIQPDSEISLFNGVPKMYFPIFWFEQKGNVPRSNILGLKILLFVPMILNIIGVVLILAALMLSLYLFVFKRNEEEVRDKDEQNPLNPMDKVKGQQ